MKRPSTQEHDSGIKRKKEKKSNEKNKCEKKIIIKVNNVDTDNGTKVVKEVDEIENVDNNNKEEVIEENDDEIENENFEKDNIPESTEELFPILGKQKHAKKSVVKQFLPRWLAEPLPILETMKTPVDDVTFLDENTIKNLHRADIKNLFPVQACVILKVLSMTGVNTLYRSNIFPANDICVQAPTGSGKTLCYTLPIIEILSKTLVKQLYCLVVLPSKDLAVQVKQVFDFYMQGTQLKVGLLCGLKTFAKEQEQLVYKREKGNFCKVHIVICTPGRLVDHLNMTDGFHLKYLQFLVIDEADRLLGQDYSGWLNLVNKSFTQHLMPQNVNSFLKCQLHLQKFLFSATLTQNPEKLAQLHLFNPVYFATQSSEKQVEGAKGSEKDRFVLPDQLVEKLLQVEISEKPLAMVHLMLALKSKSVLCFTNSLEATHRLYLLLNHFEGFTVAEFSSNLNKISRKGVIRDFRNGKIDLLISSDAMARGMDIENVNLVVNYNAPVNSKTYIHRVGRTARAGNKGEAITLLSRKEVYHFLQMTKKLSEKSVSRMKVAKTDLALYEKHYNDALLALQNNVTMEKKSLHAGKMYMKSR